MAECAELPQDVWVQILQHVDNTQRLSASALVCRKLARAAAAATQSVWVNGYNKPERLDAFLAWTVSHGSSLTRLVLDSSPSHSTRQLPCPALLWTSTVAAYSCAVAVSTRACCTAAQHSPKLCWRAQLCWMVWVGWLLECQQQQQQPG
jgi:hypothetical protein